MSLAAGDAGTPLPSDPWIEGEPDHTGTAGRTGPRSRKWLWATVAVLAVVALVLALTRKPKDVVEEKPPPPQPVEVAPPPHEPARPFFNGKDLDGWEGLPENWQVRDGAIVGTLPPEQRGTFLCSTRAYTDFELTFRVKLAHPRGDSGVQVRSRLVERGTFLVAGPQCDIGDQHWGGLYDQANRTFIKKAPPDIEKGIEANKFIGYAIRCVGPRVTITVNGKKSIDEEFAIPDEGIIAWQVNALTLPRTTPVEVIFRDIRFTDLRK